LLLKYNDANLHPADAKNIRVSFAGSNSKHDADSDDSDEKPRLRSRRSRDKKVSTPPQLSEDDDIIPGSDEEPSDEINTRSKKR
jgi:hypothetical protein